MSNLTNALMNVLSDVTIMYHRAHGFHWNVTGPDFPQWHDKFAEIYDDVYGSIDPIAENIRKCGSFPQFRLADIAARASVLDEPVTDTNPMTLIASLAFTNNGVLASLNRAFVAANEANQQGVANFLAERIDAHQKWAWQLSASM